MGRKLLMWGLIIGMVVAFSLTAANSAISAEWKWPASLSIVTPAVGSANYAVALAWGSALEQQTGVKVRVVTQASGVVRIKWITQGMGTIGMVESHTAKDCLEGVGDFRSREAGPFDMRLTWNSQITFWGFPVKGNSPLKTVYDIKPGIKIGYLPTTPFFLGEVRSLLALLNLTEKDVTLVPMGNYPAMGRGIIENKIDTCLLCPLSTVTYELEAAPGGIRWLAIPTAKENPDGVKRWLKQTPIETFGAANTGVGSAIGVNMVVQDQLYVAKADTSTDLIYNLSKWIDQNLDLFKDKGAHADLMGIDYFRAVVDHTFIPLHEGTVQYLKEKGLWTADDEKRQAKNLDLVGKYAKAYRETIKDAEAKKIKIDPGDEKWTQMWAERKKELQLPPIGE